jgi:hypothetical protein
MLSLTSSTMKRYDNSLLYSTLLYSTLLYSTLLYSTLLYSTLLYSTTALQIKWGSLPLTSSISFFVLFMFDAYHDHITHRSSLFLLCLSSIYYEHFISILTCDSSTFHISLITPLLYSPLTLVRLLFFLLCSLRISANWFTIMAT